MFEFVRTHQRLMQFILLLFIVPSFALVGISSYMGGGNADTLAIVAGENISQQEFDNALREQMNRMRERMGSQFDEAVFNTPEAKESVLNNLITQRVLKVEARRENLSIPDTVLQQTILAIPGLTSPDGVFNYEGYKTILANQGMTPTMYESGLRQDLVAQQLTSAIQGSAFAPKTVIKQVGDIMGQQREIQSLEFNAVAFVNQVKITDAILKEYYDKHGDQFTNPESAKIEYVVLNGDAIESQMIVSDDDIKSYYDQNIKNYSTDEQRRASHILIKVDKGASSADQAAAKAKAEEVLALVRKDPANFAALAKQYSQDEGSAENGGDLDYFGKGMMVKPFEEVAFKLKKGEISDLVKSDFGYHIIELTDIKPATVKPLDEVKAQISEEIKKQKASKKMSEMAETFTNTVYEQSDSLKPAADKLHLKIETAENLTRDPKTVTLANKTNPILSNPKLLKALFSDDALKNKRNTEAVEVAPNTLVSGRIVEYKPASKRPFDEVKDAVVMLVKLGESEALAKKAGEEKLISLIAAKSAPTSTVGFGASKLISRAQQEGVPPPAFNSIMNADPTKLPAFVGVNIPGQGYTIYRINKIQQVEPDAALTAQLTQQVEELLASEDLYDFVAMLKAKDKVKIVKPLSAAPTNGS
jgi:peptidyl-prolyl cis-trans isomerase D